jgi:hypothetical protein
MISQTLRLSAAAGITNVKVTVSIEEKAIVCHREADRCKLVNSLSVKGTAVPPAEGTDQISLVFKSTTAVRQSPDSGP